MTQYVNVGALLRDEAGDYTIRPKSKKAVKEAMAADPSGVLFDKTSMLNGEGGFRGDEVPAGVTLSLVGPDPYVDRRFYGSITVGPKGVRVA